MEPQIYFDLSQIKNLEEFIEEQVEKFKNLRTLVRDLEFIPVDPVSVYSSVTYKSIDGGKMGINFDPFEFDFIVIADSVGNELMNYLVPKSESLQPSDFEYLDKFHQVDKFLELLDLNSIVNASNLLRNSKTAMHLTEYACIFERLTRDENEPIIVLMDGLLRTIEIRPEIIQKMLAVIRNHKKRKLIGVAKSSRVLNLIASALFIEKKIPHGYTGYIEVPWEIERMAYKWKGRGIQEDRKSTHLFHAFGKLYIAKLSKISDLLVTLEIPYDFENDKEIYSTREVNEVIGHLIKDSAGSYPILGYPQTIMRAHEKAVRTGFTASIWRDKIIERILNELGDNNIKHLIHESNFLREYVKKGILGGF
ncbi:MAG: DNA double-strand break repair nuclease NurA [Promethearchaeota archaeon]